MADRCRVGPQRPSCSRIAMSCVQPEQLNDRLRSNTSAGILSLYGEEDEMATSSKTYVGIDVSKDRLDVAVLGGRVWQVNNTCAWITQVAQDLAEMQPELIVVEATGGYQRAVGEALFRAGLSVAVVNPARVRQFARACGL